MAYQSSYPNPPQYPGGSDSYSGAPKTPRSSKKPKKKGNGKIYTTVTIIGLCTVLLSGGAAYGGTLLANRQNANASSSADTSVQMNTSTGQTTKVESIDVSGIVATLRPSVVEITTESVSSGMSIFGQYVSQGAGSGVILSADGYIVTNNHVIEDASNIVVKTMDGVEYPAELIGTDPQTDIAIIKVDATDLKPATIGNSDSIQVGEGTIAIGNPLGSLGGTVTTGIISAVGREITIENETMTLLQTDAAINPGNSGGGLFNLKGELIGVVNAKTSDTGIEGLGFAIPISDVLPVIEDLEEHGKVTFRPQLGVSLQEVGDSMFNFGSSLEPGLYIAQIVSGGSADNGGARVGDRIISFDGQEVSSSADLRSLLRKHSINDVIELVVDRNGTEETLTITLAGPVDSGNTQSEVQNPQNGLTEE